MQISNGKFNTHFNAPAAKKKPCKHCGSHEAAQRSAMLYSFPGTCILKGINPFIWLQNVLRRISNHPINKIEEVMPQNWKLLL